MEAEVKLWLSETDLEVLDQDLLLGDLIDQGGVLAAAAWGRIHIVLHCTL